MYKRFSLFFFLVVSHAVYGQSDSIRTINTYLGMNITRIEVGDIELQIMRKLNNAFTFGISAGYDFNFLDKMFSNDYGTRNDLTFPTQSMEQINSPERRYWWGQGIAGRMHIDYMFSAKGSHQHFISLEGLLKERDYTAHYFGEQRVVFLESADQIIGGLTLYYGTNHKENKHLIYRIHYGFGFRTLKSNVRRPAYTYDNKNYPPIEKNYMLTIPSIHFGLTILTGF